MHAAEVELAGQDATVRELADELLVTRDYELDGYAANIRAAVRDAHEEVNPIF